MSEKSGDLTDLHISSGVNEEGKPFCHISCNHGALLGQMSVEEVRELAMQWLASAEAAEQDAIVYRLLVQKMSFPPDVAGAFLVAMRNERG